MTETDRPHAPQVLPWPLRGLRILVARVLPAVSAALILAMVAVTMVDVVGRYVFEAPLPGAFELTQVLLACLVLAALPITTLKGSHVEVDLLSALWSSRTERLATAFGAGVTALVFVALAVTVAQHGAGLRVDGARTYDLQLPIWPAAALGVVTFVASAVISILPHQHIRRF